MTATNLVYRVDCSSEPPALKLRDDLSGRVLSESFMDNSQVCLTRYNLTPSSRIRIFFKVEIFSLRFGFLLSVHTAVNGVFGHQKRRFSKTVPRVAYRFFVWNDRKRRFLNTMMSYIVAAKETK